MALKIILNSIFNVKTLILQTEEEEREQKEQKEKEEIPVITIDIQSYELHKVFNNYYTIKSPIISDARYEYMEKGLSPVRCNSILNMS
jgi:hypothetical protein